MRVRKLTRYRGAFVAVALLALAQVAASNDPTCFAPPTLTDTVDGKELIGPVELDASLLSAVHSPGDHGCGSDCRFDRVSLEFRVRDVDPVAARISAPSGEVLGYGAIYRRQDGTYLLQLRSDEVRSEASNFEFYVEVVTTEAQSAPILVQIAESSE